MARPNPNPSTRTPLVIVLLAALSVAWAGREATVMLDAGFVWGSPSAACRASGPLADVAANAAADGAVACAAVAMVPDRRGDAVASFALPERVVVRLTR